MPRMIKAASHRELKRAFTVHERQTRAQVKRLERIFRQDESPRGTVRTWARLFGRDDQAELLQQTLDEEGDTDHLLTELAERLINVEAVSQDEDDE